MGILDQLKAEAAAREADTAERARTEALSHDSAARVVGPAMTAIYAYLKDLLEQVERLERKVIVDYPVAGVGKLRNLHQENYILARQYEDRAISEGFNLRFELTNGRRYRVRIAERGPALELDKRFRERGVNFQSAPGAAGSGQTAFEFEARFVVGWQFRPSLPRRAIDLTMINFDTLETTGFSVAADAVDDEFLDHLGRCLMRQPNELLGYRQENLSDEARGRLRAILDREAQSERPGERTLSPLDAGKESSVLGRLLRRK